MVNKEFVKFFECRGARKGVRGDREREGERREKTHLRLHMHRQLHHSNFPTKIPGINNHDITSILSHAFNQRHHPSITFLSIFTARNKNRFLNRRLITRVIPRSLTCFIMYHRETIEAMVNIICSRERVLGDEDVQEDPVVFLGEKTFVDSREFGRAVEDCGRVGHACAGGLGGVDGPADEFGFGVGVGHAAVVGWEKGKSVFVHERGFDGDFAWVGRVFPGACRVDGHGIGPSVVADFAGRPAGGRGGGVAGDDHDGVGTVVVPGPVVTSAFHTVDVGFEGPDEEDEPGLGDGAVVDRAGSAFSKGLFAPKDVLDGTGSID